MKAAKIAAITQIAGGILGLASGGFSYAKETRRSKLARADLAAGEGRTVNVPVWAGVGALAVGGLLLFLGSKRR